MNDEFINFIDLVISNGDLTEKSRSTILKKAESLGINKDEAELILDSKIAANAGVPKKENLIKCPSCGDTINGLSQVCSSCGYVLNETTVVGENSKNLNDSINLLEDLIVEVKSIPPPSFLERIKIIALTYCTLGLYLVYRKFFHKKGNKYFNNLVAKCEKESRIIKTYYGEDKKVRSLLDELNNEISGISSHRKKLSLNLNFGCFGIFVIAILSYYGCVSSIVSVSEELQEVKDLISSGSIEKAKQKATLLGGHEKKRAFDDIYSYEINKLILENNLEEAKNKLRLINTDHIKNDLSDKISILEINKLILENNLKEAKSKLRLINTDYKRNELSDKILIIEINELFEKSMYDEAKIKAQMLDNSYDRKKILDKISSIE